MIKECKITFRNPALNIIVCDYDGMPVQITGDIKEYDGLVYVQNKSGHYTSVTKPVKKTVKKSTVKADETNKDTDDEDV